MRFNHILKSKVHYCFEPVNWLGFLFLFCGFVSAEVTYDGSFGSNATLTAPVYVIPAGDGKQVGNNLFHSFSVFNINVGEVAKFTSTGAIAPIQNIFTRVTGGMPSNINGELNANNIPGANLFFLNPAGVVFGPGASLKVPGAFHVSTANYIRLADGGRLDTRLNSVNELLTTGSAEAFGFLGDQQPTAIHFEQSALFLAPPNVQNFTITGGDISISENSNLIAFGGVLELISVASGGEISIQNNQLKTDSFSKLGQVTLGVSTLTPSFSVPGSVRGNRVIIRGGQIVLENRMEIGSTSFNNTTSLPVIDLFSADSLTIEGELAKIQVAGSGLEINIETNKFNLLGGARISNTNINSTLSNGITISAKDIIIDGAEDNNKISGISAIGNSDITLTSDSFQATDGGFVKTEGNGTLLITAKSVTLEGTNFGERSGVFALFGNQGSSGNIFLNTDQLNILNGARVSTTISASSSGASGNLTITAKQILLDGSGGPSNQFNSSILAEAQGQNTGSGDGGDLTINTDSLIVQNKAIISARTRGPGKGGDISIQANTIDLQNQGKISAESINAGIGEAGTISINALDSILLAGKSEITVASELANAGNIDINTDLLHLKQQSSITTSVAGGLGSGGNININIHPSLFILTDASKIIANALQGIAGNITIQISNGGAFFQSFDSVIEASSQLGIDGTVEINAPDVDIVSGFKPLPDGFLDVATILKKPCAQRFQTNTIQFVNQKYQVLPDSPYALRTLSAKQPLIENRNKSEPLHTGAVLKNENLEHLIDCMAKKMSVGDT